MYICSRCSFFFSDNNLSDMLLKTSLSLKGRGGPRRNSVDVCVDDGVVLDCFGRHSDVIAHFGIYESKSTNDQPDGKGLVHLAPFLKDVLSFAPTGELSIPVIRKGLSRLVFQEPSLNGTIYNNSLWVGLRQQRVTCILNHCRRLRREEDRLRQVTLAMNGKDVMVLQDLLALLTLGPADAMPNADDSDQETIYVSSSSRKLQGHPSDASLDEEGFPKMLGSIECSSSSAAAAVQAEAAQAAPSGAADRVLQQALGIQASKGKGANVGVKRKAAADAVPDLGKKYTIMYYKANNSFGVRQCFGDKKQIASVCKKGVSKDNLEDVANKAKEKLEEGLAEEVVKAWVVAKVQTL